jgi:hypothetical protein
MTKILIVNNIKYPVKRTDIVIDGDYLIGLGVKKGVDSIIKKIKKINTENQPVTIEITGDVKQVRFSIKTDSAELKEKIQNILNQ